MPSLCHENIDSLRPKNTNAPVFAKIHIAIYQASTSILKKVAKDDVKEAWTFYHFCEKIQTDTTVLILQECDLNKHNIPDSKHSLLDLAKGETHKFGKANVEGVLTNTNNGKECLDT